MFSIGKACFCIKGQRLAIISMPCPSMSTSLRLIERIFSNQGRREVNVEREDSIGL